MPAYMHIYFGHLYWISIPIFVRFNMDYECNCIEKEEELVRNEYVLRRIFRIFFISFLEQA